MNDFSDDAGLFLFFSSLWSTTNQVSGAGFFITDSNYSIILAGCCPFSSCNNLDADLQALILALRSIVNGNLFVQHIFNSSSDFNSLIHSADSSCTWHYTHWLNTLKHLLAAARRPHLHFIPRHWLSPALKLATHASNLHDITLFHRGRELPRWIMKSFRLAGFSFN